MCGIVGAISKQNVTRILLEGLKRLEYRGYDSAGIAVLELKTSRIRRVRTEGKVRELQNALDAAEPPLMGHTGIAHTRWATHGAPSEANAHPHMSSNQIALVHNGIIENHEELRQELSKQGYEFKTDTDTESAAHLIHSHLKGNDFFTAVCKAVKQFSGAYALAIIHADDPDRIIAVRCGCPLVIGIGENEHFVASDNLALASVTNRFIYLEEGDIADIRKDNYFIYDAQGNAVKRKIHISNAGQHTTDRGSYRHFMLKEIYEQPSAVSDTLEGRITAKHILPQAFGSEAESLFANIKHVQIVACGTSYHASIVGRYWLEALAGIPCQVEIASEIRYRHVVVQPHTLFIAISQSGETADTLAALRQAKELGYEATLAICNVAESSLVREADTTFLTRAGTEIGVASTKAFTTQLVALLMLTVALGRHHALSAEMEKSIAQQLINLPKWLEKVLKLDAQIEALAPQFADKEHALFLGRGVQYPIAREGALKLKELSYIHAEAYPSGELKHGPLALVDKYACGSSGS
jgi:glucosamine--fructose-6-phosphate aminotransferase (isomerizing)